MHPGPSEVALPSTSVHPWEGHCWCGKSQWLVVAAGWGTAWLLWCRMRQSSTAGRQRLRDHKKDSWSSVMILNGLDRSKRQGVNAVMNGLKRESSVLARLSQRWWSCIHMDMSQTQRVQLGDTTDRAYNVSGWIAQVRSCICQKAAAAPTPILGGPQWRAGEEQNVTLPLIIVCRRVVGMGSSGHVVGQLHVKSWGRSLLWKR